MNNFIVAVENSAHPNVSIDLFDIDHNPILLQTDSSGRKVLYIPEDSSAKEPILKRRYLAQINVPEADAADLRDLQYIMDLRVSPELDDDEIRKLTGEETRMQVRFTSPSKGCDDYRAHARNGKDEFLELEVAIPSSVFELKDLANGDHSVSLVAGWACGHEAVTLTHPIIFLPGSASPIEDNGHENSNGGDVDVKAEDINLVEGNKQVEEKNHNSENEINAPLGEDTPNDVHDHYGHDEVIKPGRRQREQVAMKQPGTYAENSEPKHVPERNKHRRHRKEETKTKSPIRQFNQRYNSDGFGKASFTANSYVTGLLVFVFVGGTILNAIVAMSGKTRASRNKRDV